MDSLCTDETDVEYGLKKPGPRNESVQCFIKRDKKTSSYTLWQGPPPEAAAMEGEGRKFLLAAQQFRRLTSTEYIITSSPDLFEGRSCTDVVGKIQSNFLNTKYTIYDHQPPHTGAVPPVETTTSGGHISSSKEVSPGVSAGSFLRIADIAYQVMLDRPAYMECSLLTIPTSFMDPNGSAASNPTKCSTILKSKSGITAFNRDEPLVLTSKATTWDPKKKTFCYEKFTPDADWAPSRSRKNHQLIAAGTTLLEFIKHGKGLFSMDYCYPLSTFQAFAIFLTLNDSKTLSTFLHPFLEDVGMDSRKHYLSPIAYKTS